MDCVKSLKFYFRQLWEGANLVWDPDNDVEIEYIVEGIIEEAVKRCMIQVQLKHVKEI